MITILHGENHLASRNQLEALKKEQKNEEILSWDGKKITLNDLIQALEAPSLLASSRLVVIERFFSLKKSEEKQKMITYLVENQKKVNLLLWEDEEVDKTTLAQFSGAKILLFKKESVVFKFLESLKPGCTEEMLVLLKKVQDREIPEIIFSLLVRQLRLLLLISSEPKEEAEDLKRLATWQKEKLARQAKDFTQKKLISSYHELLEIDYQQKTGQNAFDLKKTLEIFIMNL